MTSLTALSVFRLNCLMTALYGRLHGTPSIATCEWVIDFISSQCFSLQTSATGRSSTLWAKAKLNRPYISQVQKGLNSSINLRRKRDGLSKIDTFRVDNSETFAVYPSIRVGKWAAGVMFCPEWKQRLRPDHRCQINAAQNGATCVRFVVILPQSNREQRRPINVPLINSCLDYLIHFLFSVCLFLVFKSFIFTLRYKAPSS